MLLRVFFGSVHRMKRPAAVKAVLFGPTDDLLILSAGKAVEVWRLAELVKQ